ncbi:MAG: fumarylacetoacetate hydrolase family protein [Xanthobacteraceae bacterium]
MSATLDDPRIAAGMRAQMDLRKRRFNEGAHQVGWKVGFGAPAAMEKLRISGPLVGFLVDQALLPSPAHISLAGWHKPVAEPEIAVHIGRDVSGEADRDSARAAISALAPAIEVADVDGPNDDVEAVLAGNIFQRHVVLAALDTTRAGARLDGLIGRVTRSGRALDVPDDLQANTGDLIDIVRHVAAVAAQFGDGLRAGHFIIAGSVVAPLFVEAGETVTFELHPIGAVSVAFDR